MPEESSLSHSSSMKGRVGMYELGQTIGQGTFAKVKYARHLCTGRSFAIKILEKETILKNKMVQLIKREISTMKLVKHPNIVQLHEVMASKTKVYFVLEYVTGGEFFEKINEKGRLSEREARKYFHQLINAVNYCHSQGVYHRDLKPENLLLDANGNLKISDFGLSALSEQCLKDGLLHTTCGTPNYVAPEVIYENGYDGAKADLWSCGVILFVLLAGFLPFEENNVLLLYKKIRKGDYNCPSWFSSGAQNLLKQILNPNAKQRITFAKILEDPWFKEGYKPAKFVFDQGVNLDDVDAVFSESNVQLETEKRKLQVSRPVSLNAFDLISFSPGLNLSGLFEMKQSFKLETRFTSKYPAPEIISKMEETARPLGFTVKKCDYKMTLRGVETGRKGFLSIITEVFEVAPSLFVVEVRKAGGDTLEYHKFCQSFSEGLKDIVWQTEAEMDVSSG
ncbi:hypothetical protein KP509_32G005800 [Ceratopteris richardii]|uniref:non-specific serine/threonine protein kinase n=2 Tax=Ceratopteris richardii TaxID=49495 RepID=A0A8T2QS35_CERRI|nr:hypothetical protein KP509_32G005800 [Ceratopteris richardii]